MRTARLIFVLFLGLPLAVPAGVEELRQDFRKRIDSALNEHDTEARAASVKNLFYPEGLDESTQALLDRTVQRLLDSSRREVHFEPLPADTVFVHALNGYEYRPNLEPLGYVVFTDPDEPAGNDTRIFYGRHPDNGRYYFPATVRKLVDPNVPADKQLQILAVGVGHPPVQFSGWCDIQLSNGKTRRVTLQDNGVGNQSRFLRGQTITACELRRQSDHGTLSLQLLEGKEELFKTARSGRRHP